jgi:hypothetical protein
MLLFAFLQFATIRTLYKNRELPLKLTHFSIIICIGESSLLFRTPLKYIAGDSGSEGLFRTFEDFEFRAAFSDRKNSPIFTAVMVKKLIVPFSCLKLGRKLVVMSQGVIVGRVSSHYSALLIYTCAYTMPARSEKSCAKFKILKCSKQSTRPC